MQPGFEEWYRSAYPSVRAAVVVLARDVAVAEDSVADAFSEALHRWSEVRTMDSPAGWVFAVARNRVRRHHRRRAREAVLLRRMRGQPDVSGPPDIDPELWEAVNLLPERQRAAIALRYIEDLTQAQVADRIGVAPGTAAALLHQGRRSLRQTVQEVSSDEQ
jgi:RNA polymerase sigma-70 factor (ECF subfamily)